MHVAQYVFERGQQLIENLKSLDIKRRPYQLLIPRSDQSPRSSLCDNKKRPAVVKQKCTPTPTLTLKTTVGILWYIAFIFPILFIRTRMNVTLFSTLDCRLSPKIDESATFFSRIAYIEMDYYENQSSNSLCGSQAA